MIYAKLLEIQKAVTALKKNTKAFNYDYVSGDKVLSVIRPKMDELGVLLVPNVDAITTERMDYGNNKTEILYTLQMTMTWLDTEDGSKLDVKWASSGQNGFDKGFGSALTYGERYFLLKFFHLQTDKDDVDAVNTKRDREQAEQEQAERDARMAKYIKAYKEGLATKSGLDMRSAFIRDMKPSEEEIALFDKMVQQ